MAKTFYTEKCGIEFFQTSDISYDGCDSAGNVVYTLTRDNIGKWCLSGEGIEEFSNYRNDLIDGLKNFIDNVKSKIKKEFILCSAVHFKNGANTEVINIDSGVIICGRRHRDCYVILQGLTGHYGNDLDSDRENQGFLTSFNRFVDRKEAFKIAKTNQQIIHKMFDNDEEGELTSEDLF
jgi:hypothetical protein